MIFDARRLGFGVAMAVVVLSVMEACGYTLFLAKKGKLPYRFASENFYGEAHQYMTDHPYLPYFPSKGRVGSVEFNSWGGVGAEPESAKRRVRVLCYGGSSTFDDKWPGHLRRMLGERYEVLNMAQNGATTADTLVKLSLLDQDLRPDYVLLYEGINDLESSYAVGFRSDYSHRRRHIGAYPYPILKRLPRWLDYSSAFTLLKWKLIGARGDLHDHYTRPFGVYDYQAGPFGLQTYRRNLMTIHAVAKAVGARLVLGTAQYHKAGAERTLGRDFADGWEKGIATENGIVRELAKADRSILLADVERSFQPSDQTLVDFCHLTDAGGERVARAFYQALRKSP